MCMFPLLNHISVGYIPQRWTWYQLDVVQKIIEKERFRFVCYQASFSFFVHRYIVLNYICLWLSKYAIDQNEQIQRTAEYKLNWTFLRRLIYVELMLPEEWFYILSVIVKEIGPAWLVATWITELITGTNCKWTLIYYNPQHVSNLFTI